MLKTHTMIQQSNFLLGILLAISFLLEKCSGQSQCTVIPLPISLPVVSLSDNITIDLSQHFFGNNLSFAIKNGSPSIFIKEPIQKLADLSTFSIGEIVSVDGWEIDLQTKSIDNYNISFLVHNSDQQYVLYYGNMGKWESGFSHKIVVQESAGQGLCQSHIMDNEGNFIIHCDNQFGTFLDNSIPVTTLLFGNVDKKEITSVQRRLFAAELYPAKLILLENGLFIRAYLASDFNPDGLPDDKKPDNSYIQLWKISIQEMMALYDRTTFGFSSLSIMDISEGGPRKQGGAGTSTLFVLDYLKGIFKLQLNSQNLLEVLDGQDAQFYEKISIYKDRTVLSRKNSMIERNPVKGETSIRATKYEMLTDSVVLDIQVNSNFIVVRTFSELVFYRKGVSSPYHIQITDSPKTQMILFRASMVIFTNVFQDVSLEPIRINQPNLHLRMVGEAIKISIHAISKVFFSETKCSSEMQILAFIERDEQKIFKSDYDRDLNQVVFVNRPGQTQLGLNKYGSGSNISYDLLTFGTSLNFAYEVDKINETQVIFRGANFSKFEIANLHNHENIIRVQYTGLEIFYVFCTTDPIDAKRKVYCEQSFYENAKSSPAFMKYYSILSPNPLFPLVVIEATVFQHNLTNLWVRKLYQQGGTEPDKLCEIEYKKSEAGTTDIGGIELFAKSDRTLGIMILLPKMKQIDYYEYHEEDREDEFLGICKLIRSISQSDIGSGLFHPQTITIIREEQESFDIQTKTFYSLDLLIKQFNEIYILSMDIENLEDPKKALQLVKSPSKTLEGYPIDGSYQLEVQYPNVLAINQFNNLLQVYTVEAENRIKFTQELPTYHKFVNGFRFKIENSKLVAVGLTGDQGALAFYDVGAVTSFYSMFGEISGAEEGGYQETRFFSFVKPTESQQMYVISFPKKIPENGILRSYIIYPQPKLRISLTSSVHSAQSESFYLRLENPDDSQRHLINLTVANFPDNITAGARYPYATPRFDLQEDITVNTNNWLKGNVLQYKYNCQDCSMNNGTQPKITVIGKIHIKYHIPAYNGEKTVICGTKAYILRKDNLIYTMDLETKELGKSYILPNDGKCTDMHITDNWFLNQKLLLILCGRSLYGLSLLSQTAGSNLVIDYLLPTFGEKLYFHNNIAVVVGPEGAFFISIPMNMAVQYADEIFNSELGRICAVDFSQNSNHSQPGKINSYSAIVTLCEDGIVLISFTVSQNAIITYTQRQKISLVSALLKNNINIPSNSQFINTVIINSTRDGKNPDDLTLRIITIMDKFNTFQWDMHLHNDFAQQIDLLGMYNRYTDYEVTGRISVMDKYVLIEMKQGDDVIQGLYDTHDSSNFSSTVLSYYIIQAVPMRNRSSARLTVMRNTSAYDTSHQILALSAGEEAIKIYEITNDIRIKVTDPETIFTQNLLIIAQSPPNNAKTVPIKLMGIQIFKLQGWTIAILIIVSIVLVVLAWFSGLWLYRYIQTRRKMIPLLRDFLDEDDVQETEEEQERRIEKEIEQIRRKKSLSRSSKTSEQSEESASSGSEDNSKMAVINPSIRQSIEQRRSKVSQ